MGHQRYLWRISELDPFCTIPPSYSRYMNRICRKLGLQPVDLGQYVAANNIEDLPIFGATVEGAGHAAATADDPPERRSFPHW
jgi:hypothetical protein